MVLSENRHYLFFLDRKILIKDGQSLSIGRDQSCDILLEERTVSRNHARIWREKDRVFLKDMGSTNGVQLNYRNVTEQSLSSEDRIIIGPFVLVYRIVSDESSSSDSPVQSSENILSETLLLEKKVATILNNIDDSEIRNQLFDLKHIINRSKEKLSRLALVDQLTLLYNRRYFDDSLAREVERARRYSQSICLVLIDIDLFKNINDTYGHQKGDEILHLVAQTISDNLRLNDIASRYGGEELAVILPETTLPQALVTAEKLRAAVQADTLAKSGVEVTISLGVAEFRDGDNAASDMIKRADEAMYEAKKLGRNRVFPE